MFELAEISSNELIRDLTPSNIMAKFRCTRIQPLEIDALLHHMVCNQSFEVHADDEDASVEYAYDAEKMLSLSQLHCQPLGDNNEHINATQYDDEVGEYAMESIQYVHIQKINFVTTFLNLKWSRVSKHNKDMNSS